MASRLLIIQPSHYRAKGDSTLFKARRLSVVPLTLPYLAAMAPKDWDIQLVDERLESVNFSSRPDLVAISTWTLNANRANDIADEFRRRGVPVVMGGPHTYFHTDEAAAHSDAVAVGEAETTWPRILEDARAARLAKVYRGEIHPNLCGLPLPRYELLNLRRYGPFRTSVVVSSRGCPFHCEFCSERFLLGEHYRSRPVEEVVAEIKHTGAKSILFGDSNFGGKRSHAMELMEAMIPLRIRWSALWSFYLCGDREFMDLAQRSGLLHLNVGVESLSDNTLQGMNKRFNKTSRYAETFADLRRRGVSYSVNLIFGWDGEEPSSFATTLQFLSDHKVPVAYFNILTPVKGTPLYERLLSESRVINAEDIDRWPGQICYMKPTNGTPAELESNVQRLYRDFYSLGSIFARLPPPFTKSNIASWVINLSQRRMALAQNNNFDGY